MTTRARALDAILKAQRVSRKPLAVILAGHNGSGKTTLWYGKGLSSHFQIPLFNADRLMMSILPNAQPGGHLPKWAAQVRDSDPAWMEVAQKGVEAFVAKAMGRQVSFAMETVFSHWRERPDGGVESKVDLIRQLQASGYFVLLVFVGLSSPQLSVGRVAVRVASGGHAVAPERLKARFPRTQRAIRAALPVADAAALFDNSRGEDDAFTVCHIRAGGRVVFDCRAGKDPPSVEILRWLDVVCPL